VFVFTQFAIVLHLLQQGCLMLEYEALKPLFKFLQVLKNCKKHWAKLMHQEVLKVTRAIVGLLAVWLLTMMQFL